MQGEWLNDKLYSIDEKVRVEKGPQLIELICNEENLRDEVTAAHYVVGKIDARGRVIMPEKIADDKQRATAEANRLGTVSEGEVMSVLDWRSKHVPHAWKIYQDQETDQDKYQTDDSGKFVKDSAGKLIVIGKRHRFIMVDEIEDKDEAIARAQTIAGEM